MRQPKEVLEACLWWAKDREPGASRLGIATKVKRMSSTEIRIARAEHAAAGPRCPEEAHHRVPKP